MQTPQAKDSSIEIRVLMYELFVLVLSRAGDADGLFLTSYTAEAWFVDAHLRTLIRRPAKEAVQNGQSRVCAACSTRSESLHVTGPQCCVRLAATVHGTSAHHLVIC